MWYALQDKDRFVYHYTSSETAAQKILPSRLIRFSRLRSVNDPREFQDYSWTFICDVEVPDTAPIAEAVNRALKDSWRIGCFCSDPYESLVTRAREDKGEDIISAAYERGHSRPRMWSQYGRDHSGACLVFDKELLHKAVFAHARERAVYFGHVEYKNPSPLSSLTAPHPLKISLSSILELGPERAVQQHLAIYHQALFFQKAVDWMQEREYRWTVHWDKTSEFFVDISTALVGIALGERMDAADRSRIARVAGELDVSLAVMRWRNGFPQPEPMHWRPLVA